MFCFKVTDAAVEQAKMLLTSTGPEPRTCLKQPISASDSTLPSELQIKESVEVWNNTRETNLRYKHQFPTLEHEKRTGAEMRRAIVSGIVPGDALVSYWPKFFSLSLVTIPEVFAKVNSSQFASRV